MVSMTTESVKRSSDKMISSYKNNGSGQTNLQNENFKTSTQSNLATNNSLKNNLSEGDKKLSSLTGQITFVANSSKSTSRENLDQINYPHHHQSHTNLSNLSPLNDHQSSVNAAVNINQNINALVDLPPSRETYKSRKKIYQQEKKKLAEQLLSTLNDPTVVVLAEWLTVRTTFKAWTKVWCELRPGLLVIYKSPKVHKSGQWIGTILLNICNVIERPSKKGFCFKIFSPVVDQNIWAKQGPKAETYGALTLPLPMTYLMIRATGQIPFLRWLKAINLSFQSSKQLIRNDLHSNKDLKLNTEILNRLLDEEEINVRDDQEIEQEIIDQDLSDDQNSSVEHEYNRSSDSDTTGSIENDYSNRHINKQNVQQHQSDEKLDKHPQSTVKKRINKSCHNIDANLSSQSSQQDTKSRSRQLITLKQSPSESSLNGQLDQTEYVYQPEEQRFGIDNEHNQSEDVGEENKSLLWSLLKQVRPGDLSKVVLPTFILEPRSFLEKLADFYYHCDILASATHQKDPFERMKEIVKWYISGMYKKPNGLKKPYNPILGEQFRCYFEHRSVADDPQTSSHDHQSNTKTFYVAEQVSHHPPISAFYCVNRNQGYSVSGVVKVSSNYYGNSVSAVLDGAIRLSLINRGEKYSMNMPFAHCKGILFGSLTYEMGGKVHISCEKTNYSCDLEFKLKPFLGGEMNLVYGKIKLGNETLASIEGHWDKIVNIKEKRAGKLSVLWEANQEAFSRRLKRYVVPLEKQHEFESTNLWLKVSEAIKCGDQKAATVEKTKLEDRQRKEAKFRLENNVQYQPKLFKYDPLVNEWHYIYEDKRPWDRRTDIIQFEKSFIIQTLTKHRTISKAGLPNVNNNQSIDNFSSVELSSTLNRSSYSTNIVNQPMTVQKSIRHHKRSSNTRSKNREHNRKSISNDLLSSNQDHTTRKSDASNNSFDKFDSVDGDEEGDTDYSSSTARKSNTTCKLLKRIEQNESDIKKSISSLKCRQLILEQIVIDQRQKLSNQSIFRSIFQNTNSPFFSISNLMTVFILSIAIQLIIYKFSNNNSSRK